MEVAIDKSAQRHQDFEERLEQDLGDARAPRTRAKHLDLLLLWRHLSIFKGEDDPKSWAAVLTVP